MSCACCSPAPAPPPPSSIPKVVVSFVLANRSYTSPLVYSRHCTSSRTNNKRPNRPSKHPPLFISTTSSTTTVCPIPNATGIGISVGGWSPSSRHHPGGGGGGGVGGADSHASDALSLLDALGGESLPEKERRLSQEIAKLQKLRQQLLAQHATAASPDYADNSQRVSLLLLQTYYYSLCPCTELRLVSTPSDSSARP